MAFWHTTKEQLDPAPIDLNLPTTIETATLALGWFWGPDAQFGSLPYPNLKTFVNSTAVTRANAFVGGYADQTLTNNLIPQLGLSEKSASKLQQAAQRYW